MPLPPLSPSAMITVLLGELGFEEGPVVTEELIEAACTRVRALKQIEQFDKANVDKLLNTITHLTEERDELKEDNKRLIEVNKSNSDMLDRCAETSEERLRRLKVLHAVLDAIIGAL